MTSFKPEVCTSNGIEWSGNATRFATNQEAEAYVFDLSCRWLAVTKTRVVESPDPVNYTWDPVEGAKHIEGAFP